MTTKEESQAFVYTGGNQVVPKDVVRVRIDPSVKVIKKGAFQDCTKLKEVEFTEGLKRIDALAFFFCLSLQLIVLPKTLRMIGRDAFHCCQAAKVVVLNHGLVEIRPHAFAGCTMLTHICLPTTLRRVGYRAFACCTELRLAGLNEGLEEIGRHAFLQCWKLETIGIPSTVSHIGEDAIPKETSRESENPTKVWERAHHCLLEAAEMYGTAPRSHNHQGLEVSIDSMTTKEESQVFVYTGGNQVVPIDVVRVKIDPSVKVIRKSAFVCCTKLKEVEFTEGLEEIGDRGFFFCSSLQLIVLPKTLRTIGAGAFYCCRAAKVVVLNHGLVEIKACSFTGCTMLTHICLPTTLRCLEEDAFACCTELRLVGLNAGLEEIGRHAFLQCWKLETIGIPSTVSRIGEDAIPKETSRESENPTKVWERARCCLLEAAEMYGIGVQLHGSGNGNENGTVSGNNQETGTKRPMKDDWSSVTNQVISLRKEPKDLQMEQSPMRKRIKQMSGLPCGEAKDADNTTARRMLRLFQEQVMHKKSLRILALKLYQVIDDWQNAQDPPVGMVDWKNPLCLEIDATVERMGHGVFHASNVSTYQHAYSNGWL